jgi:hypothetical protein
MIRLRFALSGLCLLGILCAGTSGAQVLDARRLGMGGVTTSDNGSSATANCAFRAVPERMTWGSIPLPIGVIQYLNDPIVWDPKDPEFNAFSIASFITSPPVGWVLNKPREVSSDITITIARDSLVTDLGDVRRAIPKDELQFDGVYHLLGVGKRFHSVFVQINPLLEVKNSFDMSGELRGALRDARPFLHNTRYGLTDHAITQGAIAYQVGLAFRALHTAVPGEDANPDPRRNGTTAFYVGVAPKYLMGLGFGEVYSTAGITTGDTLFGDNSPVTIDANGSSRYAAVGLGGGAGGLGHGFGIDVGTVFYRKNYEVGVGLSDLGDQIHYKTNVDQLNYDYTTDTYDTNAKNSGIGFTSYIPATLTVNVAKRSPNLTIAADMVAGNNPHVRYHVGAERWFGPLAVRAGVFRDPAGEWQGSIGSGYRIIHSLGLDAAIATHTDGSTEDRVAELVTSLTIY